MQNFLFANLPFERGKILFSKHFMDIMNGSYAQTHFPCKLWDAGEKADMFPQDEKYEKRMKVENAYMDDTAIKLGIFDQRCFYNAFAEFDNQDIEASLKSENLIVKIFAVLDRRVGKRRLRIMKETIMEEPDTFQEFYAIRAKAEGLL